MPRSSYLKLLIDGQQLDMQASSELPISISYKLEDPSNFQSRKSSESFDISVPATVSNDRILNTFHNPAVEDFTIGGKFRRFRPCVIEVNSQELLVGKALLTGARHTNCPLDYSLDVYGNNGDWIIDLKEATLFDFLNDITFTFTKANIIASWVYDGTDPALPYCFAPVRYGRQMETSDTDVLDYNMVPEYMKPSISVYWLIFRAFKSLGYRVSSEFMDTSYFRRLLMPWTWGNFLFSDGTRLDNLDFLAKSSIEGNSLNISYTGFMDVHADNDSTNGGFDNNGVYSYSNPSMNWEYLSAFDYGTLEATFHISMFVDAIATANSDTEAYLRWYKNGVQQGGDDPIVVLNAPTIGSREFIGTVDKYKTFIVEPDDVITARVFLDNFDSGMGRSRIHLTVDAFQLDYFRIPLGGTIAFSAYGAFKKYKFLDFLSGILDCFNISPVTDPINKVVYLEPMHDYSLTNDLSATSGGYLNGKFLNWNEKQDLIQPSSLDLFNDNDQEMLFQLKEDSADGMLKKVQDRNSVTLAQGKYAFSDRFKAGKKEIPNKFFSPVMHAELLQWKGLGSDAAASPQIVCLIPENISNTSREEAQNTFAPKLCHYKGMVDHVGWVFDGEVQDEYPYMFAVNYQEGGENDPILSYSDERIGPEDDYVLGKGLLRRFYLQRMAIMRNGQFYETLFRLNNYDISNWLHREHIVCRDQRWELVEINDYLPLQDKSTRCLLRKWVPVSQEDADNVYPSNDSMLLLGPPVGNFDMKYFPMKCLSSDIPVIS